MLCVESHAFGVLGQQGRGACKAAGLQPGQVSSGPGGMPALLSAEFVIFLHAYEVPDMSAVI
jgi:hypothetical protein